MNKRWGVIKRYHTEKLVKWKKPDAKKKQKHLDLRKYIKFLHVPARRLRRSDWMGLMNIYRNFHIINSLNNNPTKGSNTLKQFVGNLLTNCLNVFDHFVKLALKGLTHKSRVITTKAKSYKSDNKRRSWFYNRLLCTGCAKLSTNKVRYSKKVLYLWRTSVTSRVKRNQTK